MEHKEYDVGEQPKINEELIKGVQDPK